jgi:RNA polymerase sigma-70 factor (ECF subfamily)
MDFRADILPHRDRLYRLALSITAHTAEAEDVVQETMLRAWQHRDEWSQIQNPAAWLAQVCKRLALDSRKRLDRLRPLDVPTTDNEHPRPLAALYAEGAAAPTASPAEAFEQRESISRLSELIRQLPPPQDDLIRLRDIEGLSYRDIALQPSLTEDQVRVYLHRARISLRDQYLRQQ